MAQFYARKSGDSGLRASPLQESRIKSGKDKGGWLEHAGGWSGVARDEQGFFASLKNDGG